MLCFRVLPCYYTVDIQHGGATTVISTYDHEKPTLLQDNAAYIRLFVYNVAQNVVYYVRV